MSNQDRLTPEEIAYEQGTRRAWLMMLGACLKGLGENASPEAAWMSERQEAIASLRRICATCGDNDWPPDLHLADILDKHLGRYIESER